MRQCKSLLSILCLKIVDICCYLTFDIFQPFVVFFHYFDTILESFLKYSGITTALFYVVVCFYHFTSI